jgi:hypothetical protein
MGMKVLRIIAHLMASTKVDAFEQPMQALAVRAVQWCEAVEGHRCFVAERMLCGKCG